MPLSFEVFIPDGDEARELAEQELSRAIYAEATPTFLDIISREIAEFLLGLFSSQGGAAIGPWGAIIAGVIIVAALVVALLVWGIPRRARATRTASRDLLGDADTRTAAQLRGDAEKHARSGEWEEAIILRYRAIARSLLERDLIDPAPGATAQAIAREAAAIFTAETQPLASAASLFDGVRYLARTGTESDYREIAELDERIRTEQPELVAA